MQDLTITLIQAKLAWEAPDENLSRFGNFIDGIKTATDLILLPEMFNTGFTMNAAGNFEEMEGKSMAWMSNMAGQKNCVIGGSLIIKAGGKYYNRFIWMRPDGSYDYYDKKHLFRMGDEHSHYSPGENKLITDLKGWKVLPLICYDLRFPAWSKNSFRDGKYKFDLLLYVANWPAIRSIAWHTLVRARAIENMVYTAGLNRTGIDGRGYEYAGGSLVAAPDGTLLAESRDTSETVISCTLKADPLNEIREKLGVGNDWDEYDLR
ncbi:MAG TPA: amidohydrolase [Bacteroidales bacterium]|nr:amidohydrolase [Bacteroidales bacterium]